MKIKVSTKRTLNVPGRIGMCCGLMLLRVVELPLDELTCHLLSPGLMAGGFACPEALRVFRI